MMNTTLKTGLICLLITFSLLSCRKDGGIFKPTDEKIQGTWVYEKVKFRKNFSLSRKDLTSEFKNKAVQFNGDILTLTDVASNTAYTGYWLIDEVYTPAYNETSSASRSEFLVGTFDEPTDSDERVWVWKELRVSNKRIRCVEEKDGGTYSYVLIEQ